MANEISYQLQILLSNGLLTDNYSSGSVAVDQSSAKLVRNVQTIGTAAHEALDMGDLTGAGYAVFVNLDDTNFVEIGADSLGSFIPFIKLLPGEKQGPIRLATTAPYAKADTADVELFYIIYDE